MNSAANNVPVQKLEAFLFRSSLKNLKDGKDKPYVYVVAEDAEECVRKVHAAFPGYVVLTIFKAGDTYLNDAEPKRETVIV